MIVDEECNWSTLALPLDYFLKGNLEIWNLLNRWETNGTSS